MNCEDISKKAIELNINKEDIIIKKEVKNGWHIETMNLNKADQIKELKQWIYTL